MERASFLFFVFAFPFAESILDGNKFSSELTKMANLAIGVEEMQQYYDSLRYDKSTATGTEIVEKMTETLQRKFSTLADQLRDIKKVIEDDYENFLSSGPVNQCCLVTGTYSPKFRTSINETSACISETKDSVKKIPSTYVENIMKTNYGNNPNILWQYFGGQDGTFIIYPAQKFSSNCHSYDPRYKQYYVASATSTPKDVVVAVDISKSMATLSGFESKSLMVLARDATQTVIDTLGPDDRVGVVAFNLQSMKPSSCHGSTLAIATTTNKNTLKDFTNTWTASGESDFSAGLQAAFSYFKADDSAKGELRDKIILFLTDGERNGGTPDPLDVVKTENEALNNSVKILTYALGEGISHALEKELTDISKQIRNDKAFGEIKVGSYHKVSAAELKPTMASYYTDLSSSSAQNNPVFSVPYVDRRSNETGLITSLCLPVYSGGSLVGVTCTDILLSELLSDITYFQQGELSYAFMIDGKGRVMVHYLQPTPSAITRDPDPIDIHKFETVYGAKEIIASMKRGESGSKTITSPRTISRGVLVFEGIESRNVKSHYFWKNIPGTNFSLCVVLGDDDQQSTLAENQVLLKKDGVFVYHRRDLYPGHWKNCRKYDRFATNDKSMVMLTPHAFENPFEYLYKNETVSDIQKYDDYLNNRKTDQSEGTHKLKSNVKSKVQATYKAEEIWIKNNEQAQYVIWRYLGTIDGHVRVYPAVQITKDYNHFTRPWWSRTVAAKGKNVVVSPYIDNWGAGVVISQCRTIYEGRTTTTKSSIVDTVMCIDYPYPFFSRMFLQLYPVCQSQNYRCMVVDASGFLVIYPSFLDVTDKPDIERKHLGIKEGRIMESLLTKGKMSKQGCLDLESKRELYSYRINLNHDDEPLDYLLTDGYMIAPVQDSNVYIIIKRSTTGSNTCCPSPVLPDAYVCTSGRDCCLCHNKVQYDTCIEETTSTQGLQACSARVSDSNHPAPVEKAKAERLEHCFNAQCGKRKNESNCYSVAGCSWCLQDSDGITLTDGYKCCNDFQICPFGKVEKNKALQCEPITSSTTSTPSSELPIGALAGGAIGGVVVIVIIIAVVVILYMRRLKRDDINDTYLTPSPDVPDNSAQPIDYHTMYLASKGSSDGSCEKIPEENQYI